VKEDAKVDEQIQTEVNTSRDTLDFWADLKIKLHKAFLVNAELIKSDMDDLVKGIPATQKVVVWKYVQVLNKRLQRDIFFSPEFCNKVGRHSSFSFSP
jgi:hypothetical protein